jgi:hypothetical protein
MEADGSSVFVQVRYLLALVAIALASSGALAALLLGGPGSDVGWVSVGEVAAPVSEYVSPQRAAALVAEMKKSFALSARTVKADVRAAVPVIEAYAADHNGSYMGATADRLRHDYEPSLAPGILVVFATPTYYCLQSNLNSFYASYTGPHFGRHIVMALCDPSSA